MQIFTVILILVIGSLLFYTFSNKDKSICEKSGGQYTKGYTDIFGSHGGGCSCPEGTYDSDFQCYQIGSGPCSIKDGMKICSKGVAQIDNEARITAQQERSSLTYDYGYNLRTDEQRLNPDTLTIERTQIVHGGIDPELLTKKSYIYNPRTGTKFTRNGEW